MYFRQVLKLLQGIEEISQPGYSTHDMRTGLDLKKPKKQLFFPVTNGVFSGLVTA